MMKGLKKPLEVFKSLMKGLMKGLMKKAEDDFSRIFRGSSEIVDF